MITIFFSHTFYEYPRNWWRRIYRNTDFIIEKQADTSIQFLTISFTLPEKNTINIQESDHNTLISTSNDSHKSSLILMGLRA